MVIIAIASAMGWAITVLRIPQNMVNFCMQYVSNKFAFLFLVNILLLVIGCILDQAPALLIMVPILLPIATKFGIDPVHFGLIICTVVTMGNCTPPVGLSMYTVNSILDCSLGEYTREMVPWLISFVVAVGILVFFPAPFLFLQDLLF